MFSNRFIYKVFGCKCPNTIYSPKPRGKTTTRWVKNIANGHTSRLCIVNLSGPTFTNHLVIRIKYTVIYYKYLVYGTVIYHAEKYFTVCAGTEWLWQRERGFASWWYRCRSNFHTFFSPLNKLEVSQSVEMYQVCIDCYRYNRYYYTLQITV